LWIAKRPGEIAEALGVDESSVRLFLRVQRANSWLYASPGPRHSWIPRNTFLNAMYVSAYLDAAAVLSGEKGAACRAFALKTLDRMLAEALERHARICASVLAAASRWIARRPDFCRARIIGCLRSELDRKYFDAAQRAADFAIAEYSDSEGGGFFDRASGPPPMGGLEVRRKPLQDHPRRERILRSHLLDRLAGYTTGEGSAEPVRKKVSATRACRSDAGSLRRHRLRSSDSSSELRTCRAAARAQPFEIVITGKARDPQAATLENARIRFIGLQKPCCASHRSAWPPAGARSGAPLKPSSSPRRCRAAIVCVGMTCRPPVTIRRYRSPAEGSSRPVLPRIKSSPMQFEYTDFSLCGFDLDMGQGNQIQKHTD